MNYVVASIIFTQFYFFFPILALIPQNYWLTSLATDRYVSLDKVVKPTETNSLFGQVLASKINICLFEPKSKIQH